MSEALELKINSKVAIKEIEKEIFNKDTVIIEKIDKLFKYENLLLEEKEAIDKFCAKIDLYDSTQITSFGDIIKQKIEKNSKKVSTKIKDIEKIIKVVSNLQKKIEELDSFLPKTLNPKGIKSIFFNTEKESEKIIIKFSEIELNISKDEKELESNKIKLLKNITLLDTIYEESLKYFKEISLYILVGERLLKKLKINILPELRKEAKKNKVQNNVKTINEVINKLERKLLKLKDIRIYLIQIALKIKIIQKDDRLLVNKSKELLAEISNWKNNSIRALGISNNSQKTDSESSNIRLNELQEENKIIIDKFNKKISDFQKRNENHIKNKQEIIELEKQI